MIETGKTGEEGLMKFDFGRNVSIQCPCGEACTV